MGQVLVAFADGDADIGAQVAAALADAGVAAQTHAGAPSLKADKDRFDAASAVVLVWSRHTAGEAALRREALAAAGRGKLVIARADAGRPPPSLRVARSWPVTRANAVAGARRLAKALADANPPKTSRPQGRAAAPPSADAGNPGSTWKGTILIGLIVAGLAWAAATVAFGPQPLPAIRALLGV
ncbi:MAG: hypothetical protein NW200_14370 [Hyphomonadaceae bacterium]|nr:hypothetical protein [Hyphomonadaceae bacterium]